MSSDRDAADQIYGPGYGSGPEMYPHLDAIAAPDEDGVWIYTSGATSGLLGGEAIVNNSGGAPFSWSSKTAAEILADVTALLATTDQEWWNLARHTPMLTSSSRYFGVVVKPRLRRRLQDRARRGIRRPKRFTMRIT